MSTDIDREGTDPVVLDRVTRRFGSKLVLDAVSLRVPRGVVYGLVGENGAGKTTLIRHVLGLLRPQGGTVRVFGRDPVRQPVEVLGRLGYLSEDRDLPDWMRVRELMQYQKAFYPRWDDAHAEELRQRFELAPEARLSQLSQGGRARAGLLVALAHRPELLVLDEPSTGLDPVVRRDILAAIVRTIAEEGRTVLFSSHLLDEVERVADQVAMLDTSGIVLSGPLDEIKETHLRAVLRFDEPREAPPELEGALAWMGGGREWSVLFHGPVEELEGWAAALDGRLVEKHMPGLDDIFVAYAMRRRSGLED
jgi:ABC-2 type transport system ATP-binding protein